MGKKGIEIVNLDVPELLAKLNTALADEWLACYQYWVGAKVVRGPFGSAVAAELEEHAKEELKHAGRLAKRINQLGGTPALSPEEWFKITKCGYYPPKDSTVMAILSQNLEGERCAIAYYKGLLDFVHGKDPLTSHMVAEILKDEVEHETEIEVFLEELKGS